jgi:hypothetical protein
MREGDFKPQRLDEWTRTPNTLLKFQQFFISIYFEIRGITFTHDNLETT